MGVEEGNVHLESTQEVYSLGGVRSKSLYVRDYIHYPRDSSAHATLLTGTTRRQCEEEEGGSKVITHLAYPDAATPRRLV